MELGRRQVRGSGLYSRVSGTILKGLKRYDDTIGFFFLMDQ